MISVTCVSDLHGYKPELEGGDLLILGGDLTARGTAKEYHAFNSWLETLPFQCKVVIAGNHDELIEKSEVKIEGSGVHYLQDSGCEFKGLKIWGTPWTRRMRGQNWAMAFSVKDEIDLCAHFDQIPTDIDILLSHAPPFGILDVCRSGSVGSEILRQAAFRIKPKLCCFGHIHEKGGHWVQLEETCFVNASIVNEHYQEVNDPITINLSIGRA